MLRLDCSTLKFLEAFRNPWEVIQGLGILGTDASSSKKPMKMILLSKQKSISFLAGSVFLWEAFLVSWGGTIKSSIFKQVAHNVLEKRNWESCWRFVLNPSFVGYKKVHPLCSKLLLAMTNIFNYYFDRTKLWC